MAVRRISQGLERGNNTCHSTSGNLVLIPFLSLLNVLSLLYICYFAISDMWLGLDQFIYYQLGFEQHEILHATFKFSVIFFFVGHRLCYEFFDFLSIILCICIICFLFKKKSENVVYLLFFCKFDICTCFFSFSLLHFNLKSISHFFWMFILHH